MRANRLDDLWDRFAIYRDRYGISDGLAELDSLDKSIRRRELRAAALRRRQTELRGMLDKTERELYTVESEIKGARETGALLVEEVLDRVREERNEGWTPSPIHGFRVWRVEGGAVLGNQMTWKTETMEATCLQNVPGEDLPHSVERCGPPPCGIYAVKSLDRFPAELASGAVRNSVVGVAALTGKVVEHELGFRARRATAVAALINVGGNTGLIVDPRAMALLFADPIEALARSRSVDKATGRAALESIQRKEATWT